MLGSMTWILSTSNDTPLCLMLEHRDIDGGAGRGPWTRDGTGGLVISNELLRDDMWFLSDFDIEPDLDKFAHDAKSLFFFDENVEAVSAKVESEESLTLVMFGILVPGYGDLIE